MSVAEIKVPDLGDYKNVPVIEISVNVGDHIEKEQSLITLETDKATMDVPSPMAGIVKELQGDPSALGFELKFSFVIDHSFDNAAADDRSGFQREDRSEPGQA